MARIENYGAFLQLEDGRMGLVHISEIDRNYVKDVRDHLREGDTVEAKVVAIKDDGKIDLSIKALQDPAPPRPRRGSDPEFEQMPSLVAFPLTVRVESTVVCDGSPELLERIV